MTEEQAFALMRFQILSLGLNPATENHLTDAYVYAWEESVYPLYSSAAPWHAPFAMQFEISEAEVDELGAFLDDHWLKKTVPTFYELEDHYQVRQGTSSWDRSRLIRVCRYMFLQGMFDEYFWDSLLAATKHPSEASSIVRKMHRQTDVYLN